MNTDHKTDCGYALLQLTRDNITSAMEETRFLGIALCTRGTARVTMNVNTYDLAPNSILIIPPNSSFSVRVLQPGLHRHTSVEFLIRCECQRVSHCQPPKHQCFTLPLYIPPAPENAEIYNLSGCKVSADNLPAGVYIVRLGSQARKILVR